MNKKILILLLLFTMPSTHAQQLSPVQLQKVKAEFDKALKAKKFDDAQAHLKQIEQGGRRAYALELSAELAKARQEEAEAKQRAELHTRQQQETQKILELRKLDEQYKNQKVLELKKLEQHYKNQMEEFEKKYRTEKTKEEEMLRYQLKSEVDEAFQAEKEKNKEIRKLKQKYQTELEELKKQLEKTQKQLNELKKS